MRPSPNLSTIVVQDGQNKDRELFPSLEFGGSPSLRWDQSGQALLAWGRGSDRSGIYRIDSSSGQSSLVLEGDRLGFGDWSPDGRYAFYKGAPDGRGLIRRDIRTGEEKTLYVAGSSSMRPVRNSPGGNLLFFSEEDNESGLREMIVLSVEDGQAKHLGEVPENHLLPFRSSRVVWSPDSSRVYFVTRKRNGSRDTISEIHFVSVREGGLSWTGIASSDSIRHLAIHPDGRQLAWTVSKRVHIPWVMENFLTQD